jgi:hypothetical protein
MAWECPRGFPTAVAYPRAADNVSRPLVSRLKGLYQPVVRRAWRSWGLCRLGLILELEIGVPSFEHRAQLSVEDLDTSLQEQMGAAFAPLHLRFLAEPLAHDLVDR